MAEPLRVGAARDVAASIAPALRRPTASCFPVCAVTCIRLRFQAMSYSDFVQGEKGLLYKDGKVGKGRTPQAGDRCVVEWTGAAPRAYHRCARMPWHSHLPRKPALAMLGRSHLPCKPALAMLGVHTCQTCHASRHWCCRPAMRTPVRPTYPTRPALSQDTR